LGLTEIAGEVRRVTNAIGTKVVLSSVAGSDRVPSARLEPKDFLELLKICTPRLVYLFEDRFDAEKEALLQAEADPDNESEEDSFAPSTTPQYKSMVKRWSSHDGELCSLTAFFMLDGILHVLTEREAWLGEFEDEVDTLLSKLENERDERLETIRAREESEVAEKARKLAHDPRFNVSRPTVAKREALAKSLFPGMDPRLIKITVKEADKLLWLEKNHDGNS
jgi:hypothetical protein